MTGTINSGNLIGPVSGIPAKSQAAKRAGYTRLLIPEWDLTNNTPSSDLSIDVVKVSTLEDALYYFTNKNYTTPIKTDNMAYSADYVKVMSEITLDLCTKYGGVVNNTLVLPNLTAYGINISNSSQDNFVLAMNALNNNSYYSAASFCFGGNVKILDKKFSNMSNKDLKLEYAKLLGNISIFEEDVAKHSRSLSTISGLEAYMVVAERLSESKETLSKMNIENISAYQLAYSTERFNTAVEWSKFYSLSGQEFVMDEQFLDMACKKKLSEAEERLNYLELYYPSSDIRDELSKAYEYYNDKDYALCIFTSSKVKAESDIVLSAIFVPDNETSRLLDEKLIAARGVIAKQQQSNIFPILGYSYYEYSKTLKDSDKYSALLYAEYSLELSNLDMYFKKKESLSFPTITFNNVSVGMFLLGLSVGILFTLALAFVVSKMTKKKAKRKK
jgi:predicted S18 family serine protease